MARASVIGNQQNVIPPRLVNSKENPLIFVAVSVVHRSFCAIVRRIQTKNQFHINNSICWPIENKTFTLYPEKLSNGKLNNLYANINHMCVWQCKPLFSSSQFQSMIEKRTKFVSFIKYNFRNKIRTVQIVLFFVWLLPLCDNINSINRMSVNQMTCCWHFDWLFFIYTMFRLLWLKCYFCFTVSNTTKLYFLLLLFSFLRSKGTVWWNEIRRSSFIRFLNA